MVDDIRCADADLQLDVDTMILDYTLFQSTQAQLHFLSGGLEDNEEEEGRSREALRLLTVFDSFIQIFNEHHSDYEHSPGLTFRLDILEFLVLLSGLSSGPSPHFTDEMLEKLKVRAQDDIQARRRWQAARQRHFRRPEKRPATVSRTDLVERDVERQIYEAWTYSHPSTPYSDPQSIKVLLLFHLVPRFMVISAKFSDLIDQSLEQRWMRVACELMLRTGLETLRFQTLNRQAAALPSLEDCFSWGYVDPRDTTDIGGTTAYNDEVMDLVNEMLRLRDDSSGYTAGGIEDPEWTKLRISTLHEFSIVADASVASRMNRFDRLAEKYPLEDFVQKLVGVVHNIWELSSRDEYLGKPALVEIEEGHLQSLDIVGADFDGFASKVGLVRRFDSPARVDVSLGGSSEQSLNERFQHELRRLKRLSDRQHNGTSPVIKSED
ncbi:hypothetical protein G647_04650 [Cladophialophora carrionii CBS 160.54]|uniref:Uncharacterized protein n=1 Tax=Cladophialophora carrionii CBS 160.54 TaxID=1279043 RepID=V9DEI9_9EURO|nr:uncharacterized protein G647_04650 [Cladophialophora carrionii CBS 160.54]ETI25275.1 hypothetical protein G647_04650 [Cladophialophora carrionii CBS 160.54]